MIKEISREAFAIKVLTKRDANSNFWIKELKWFEDTDQDLLGMVGLDNIDNNLTSSVFQNDGFSQYKPIRWKTDIESLEEAIDWIQRQFAIIRLKNSVEHVTHESEDPSLSLFEVIGKKEQLNKSFLILKDSEGYSPAKELLNSITSTFDDIDGNFVKDFQTTGFDARIWELFLYCFLKEQHTIFDRSYNRPDFICDILGEEFCVEAVTVGRNKHNKKKHDDVEREMKTLFKEYSVDEMATRFGSPLFSKLNKNYQDLEQVKGKPLIFAIADFFEEYSMIKSHEAICTYLYGRKFIPIYNENDELIVNSKEVEYHLKGEVEIPSGFFFQENAENISAVIFSNNGTISKFNRIGLGVGLGNKYISMIQEGVCYKHDQNAIMPDRFIRNLSSGKFVEMWSEGVNIYHNPVAKHPLDSRLFKNVAQHFIVDDKFISSIPKFHPYYSTTSIMNPVI